jgi:anti-sigma factor (TIGR02949 family)
MGEITLNCDEVRELLSPYLDRELTGEEMTALGEHLDSCKECAAKSAIFGQLSKILNHWEGVQASNNAREHLSEQLRKINRETGQQDQSRPLSMLLLALLAGALLLGGLTALIVWLIETGTSG